MPGSEYTAMNYKDMGILTGGGRNSGINQEPNEYKIKNHDMILYMP